MVWSLAGPAAGAEVSHVGVVGVAGSVLRRTSTTDTAITASSTTTMTATTHGHTRRCLAGITIGRWFGPCWRGGAATRAHCGGGGAWRRGGGL